MNFEIINKKHIRKIQKNKEKLEKELNIKLEIKNNSVNIHGDELDCYIAGNIINAINKGFSINTALLLKNPDFVLEEINLKKTRKKKNLTTVKSRIIGTKGKTIHTLSELSECHISLYNNTVSIIGRAEKIKETITAIKSLIKGSKQSNVYSYLEKCRNNADFNINQ